MDTKINILLILLNILLSQFSFALINANKIVTEFPLVKLVFKNNSHICSATFINKTTILTAAHCISGNQHWSNYSTELAHIYDVNGVEIKFKNSRNIPHPEYLEGWLHSQHDLGIIKIDPIDYYVTFPVIGDKHSGKVLLYGCGVIDLESNIKDCLVSDASRVFNILGYLLSWGTSSVAKNDSGGALVDKKTGEIIGVHWGFLSTITSKLNLNSFNFSTSLINTSNKKFVLKHQGNP